MTMPVLRFEGSDLRETARGVMAMMMPPKMRRLWTSRMGRMLIAQARRNISGQKTVDGTPMTPRKNPGKHKRMLTGLTKSKWLGVKNVSDDEAIVHFFRNAGIVANKHQKGGRALGLTRNAWNYPVAFDSSKVPTRLNKERITGKNGVLMNGCSANQAVMMIRLDSYPRYLRSGMPGGIAGRVRYLMQHVPAPIAYECVEYGRKRAGKKNIPDKTPARPFIGVDEETKILWGDELMNGIYQRFKAKNHNNLLK